VKAWIASIPGWKSKFARRLDALIVRADPKVHKAVKWNSPFYGSELGGWYASMHCFTRYIKVSFFRGASLVDAKGLLEGKGQYVRHIKVRSAADIDRTAFAALLRQAIR